MRSGLGYLFDPALANAPEKVAVFQGDQALTFEELDRRANRVAGALQGAGIGSGARVALLFENDHRFLECYFGVLRAGAVVVPVNHRLADPAVAYILHHCDAQVAICSPGQVGRTLGLLGQVQSRPLVVGLDRSVSGMIPYGTWVGGVSDAPIQVAVAEQDIAIQAYTAGSTGRPKGCLLSHGGQLWNVSAALPLLGITPADRALVAAPLGHKNATASIKRFLRVGGPVVMLSAFDPEAYLAAVDRFGVTCTTGVPAMYRMLLARPELFARYDTRTVRFCFVASARVPYGLQEALLPCFPNARAREIYGATEAGYLIQAADGSPGLVPMSGAGVRVTREDGGECLPDEAGEILFRNPGVAKGYYKNPKLAAERIRNGWYHTGDLVRRTQDGRYVVLGRKDDMINAGGENVYPKEIEDILLRHPVVADACVVPAPHPIKGQVPVAFVVLRVPGRVTEPELKEFFLERGAAFAHPRRVFFLSELPLLAPGKIDRKSLRQQAESIMANEEAAKAD